MKKKVKVSVITNSYLADLFYSKYGWAIGLSVI